MGLSCDSEWSGIMRFRLKSVDVNYEDYFSETNKKRQTGRRAFLFLKCSFQIKNAQV